MLPRLFDVGALEVVNGKLKLVLEANFAILHGTTIGSDDPRDVVNAVHVLEKCGNALEAVGQFSGDGIEVNAAALLEIRELRDFQAIEHDLPSNAPSAERGRLPVVFFELDVVLAQVDADGGQRRKIEVLHVGGRRLEDDLKLHVLEEAIGIFSVAAVSRTPRGLHVADAIGLGAKHAEKRFGRHGAGADFDVVGLLQHATVVCPEILQAKDEFLKGQRIGGGGQVFSLAG